MKPPPGLLALLATALALLAAPAASAQKFDPPAAKPPDADTLKTIQEKVQKLGKAVTSLRRQGLRDPWLAEIEVYHRAVLMTVQHGEFFGPDSASWTLEALDRGLLRAALAAEGSTPWVGGTGFPVVRAYRSRIDGSVQPYAVTYPNDYLKDAKRKWRLDVVLHGRDPTLTEVKFLHQHNGDRAAPKGQDFVRLDIYGRGNNAYRWAGEADVFEAIDAFLAGERMLGRGGLLDPARVVLRGFSMGGAGTWHIGLHHPSRWCVLGPGAGFTATHGHAKGLPAKLPPWQEACLHIYDAADYAENLFNVSAVAYAGADDPQLQALRNIQARLKGADFPFKLEPLVAPGLEHKFPPGWQKKAEAAYAPFVARGRPEYPDRVRFVTWTLSYPSCAWVEVLALDRHYEKALVDAEKTDSGFKVKTANVRSLHLTLPPEAVELELTVVIDGQELKARSWMGQGGLHVYLDRRKDSWTSVLPQLLLTRRTRQPHKFAGQQGPIDDAFTDGFLCVRGTGKSWHAAAGRYADAALERFGREWARHWRGELPVKDDIDVNNEDIATKHLILFGDPSSNSLIAQVLDSLPLRWTREEIRFAGKTYDSAGHLPVLIYPSPLNAGRYVVLNSGHTFGGADYRGTNALLYPRLGDYAVLRLPGGEDPLAAEVATAGLFDESWLVGKK